MSDFVIQRHAQEALLRMARSHPVVAVMGPRQSGKTTLARQLFSDRPYQSLEDPDIRRIVETDPRGFLASVRGGAVIDEVQRVPELVSYLQSEVDAGGQMGRFIITGSQQFGVMDRVTQSLAGRVGLIELLPLASSEWATHVRRVSLEDVLFRGSYPALYDRRRAAGEMPSDWLGSYIQTYIERDVRQVLGVRNLSSFDRFVRMCAARSGQLLNVQALAADCGISSSAAREWLGVLQASYVIRLVSPWHENFGKRSVKMPKLYFLDTGLLCHLLRIESPQSLVTHAMRGPVFETWVVSETLKHRLNQALPADLYFWRDNHGVEVDLLFEHQGLLHGVEVKSGQTFVPEALRGLDQFARYAGARAAPGTLVYGGSRSFDFRGQHVLAWTHLMGGADAQV